jgi:hypothetical protein
MSLTLDVGLNDTHATRAIDGRAGCKVIALVAKNDVSFRASGKSDLQRLDESRLELTNRLEADSKLRVEMAPALGAELRSVERLGEHARQLSGPDRLL